MKYVSLDDLPPDHPALSSSQADPLRVLSELEQEQIETFHVNIFGATTMPETTNPVLTPDAAVKVHTRYTDPLDLLEDKLEGEEKLLARALPSMAWAIDNQIIVNARIFFFQEFKNSEYIGEKDGLESFLGAFRGTLDVDSVFGTDGAASTLVKLLAIRQNWHDRADSAMQADGRVYNPRSFEELILSERAAPIDSLTKAKQLQMAKFVAEGNKEEEEAMAKMLEERLANRRQTQLELSKHVGPAVLELISFATRHVGDNSAQFEHLEPLTRKRFFMMAKKFVENAVADASADRRVTEFEFLTMMKAYKECKRAIEFVLDTQYKDDPAPHIKNAPQGVKANGTVIPSNGANAKAAAARSESDDHETEIADREAARDTAAQS